MRLCNVGSRLIRLLIPKSTVNFPNKDAILKELEKNGGICDCQSSRDTLIYAASIDSRAIDSVTRLLADVTLRPTLSDQEVSLARRAVNFELETLGMRPEQEPILMDMIHAAAFRDNTLGLPKLCPLENLDHINRNVLMNYLKYHHSPKRMVIAGVGVSVKNLFCTRISVKEYLFRWIMMSWLTMCKDTLWRTKPSGKRKPWRTRDLSK